MPGMSGRKAITWSPTCVGVALTARCTSHSLTSQGRRMARERTSARIDEDSYSSTLGSVTAIRNALSVGCVVLVVMGQACAGGSSTHAGRSSAPTQRGPAAKVPAHIDAAGVSTPDGPVSDAPHSIRSDCSADVTDQLQHWLTDVPDGPVASFP